MTTNKNQKQTSSTTTTTTTTKKSGTSFSYIINILSYVAVCVGGIGLFLAMVLSKCGVNASFTSALQAIANAVGWSILCVLSFNYIKRRKKVWMWVVWAIAIVMIIIGIILV